MTSHVRVTWQLEADALLYTYLGFVETAHMHRRGADRMIEMIGGRDKLAMNGFQTQVYSVWVVRSGLTGWSG